jgi:NADPH:quinone reductase-like Zn-dependent oxidoreductase
MSSTKQSPHGATLMRAVVQDTYGSADVIHLAQVPVPVPSDDEVLLRVRAACVTRGDVHMMTGLPSVMRLFTGLNGPRQKTRGMDVAGVVLRVGSAVTSFRPGDEVFGVAKGAFADYALANPAKLALKPAAVSFEQAAAAPVSGCAALLAVRDKARVADGQTVLVIGAGGGVGSYAVQIAKSFGAHVTAVCSTGKVDFVSALGADDVVDYTREDVTLSPQSFDAIIDIAGGTPLPALRRILQPEGTLVIVGEEGAGNVVGGLGRQFRSMFIDPVSKQRLLSLMSAEKSADLMVLGELLAAGAIRSAITNTFPLGDTAAALREVETGHSTGKLVISVS